MKITNWKVDFLHPINKDVLHSTTFRNIEEIADTYKDIPLSTWRNISIGRSKIYKKFIHLEKIMLENKKKDKEKHHPQTLNEIISPPITEGIV